MNKRFPFECLFVLLAVLNVLTGMGIYVFCVPEGADFSFFSCGGEAVSSASISESALEESQKPKLSESLANAHSPSPQEEFVLESAADREQRLLEEGYFEDVFHFDAALTVDSESALTVDSESALTVDSESLPSSPMAEPNSTNCSWAAAVLEDLTAPSDPACMGADPAGVGADFAGTGTDFASTEVVRDETLEGFQFLPGLAVDLPFLASEIRDEVLEKELDQREKLLSRLQERAEAFRRSAARNGLEETEAARVISEGWQTVLGASRGNSRGESAPSARTGLSCESVRISEPAQGKAFGLDGRFMRGGMPVDGIAVETDLEAGLVVGPGAELESGQGAGIALGQGAGLAKSRQISRPRAEREKSAAEAVFLLQALDSLEPGESVDSAKEFVLAGSRGRGGFREFSKTEQFQFASLGKSEDARTWNHDFAQLAVLKNWQSVSRELLVWSAERGTKREREPIPFSDCELELWAGLGTGSFELRILLSLAAQCINTLELPAALPQGRVCTPTFFHLNGYLSAGRKEILLT